MRWMMYKWWCEGGGDRAWWVIESVFLRSLDKGFYPQTCRDGRRLGFSCAIYCWISVAFHAVPLSSGQIITRVTIGRVSPFIPRERPNANTRYCRLFKATTAYTSACTDAALSGGTRVRHWQSAQRLWPNTRRLQLPLYDCCRLVLQYNAEHSIQQTEQISNDPPQMGVKSTTVKLSDGGHHYGRSTATYGHKTNFPITFSLLRLSNERSPQNPATGHNVWNFYNFWKNLFTNTDDAILFRDYFRSGSSQSNSQISTLQVVVVNNCFTSLFGTKGLLSDILIR